jgi:spermidine synthase
MISNRDDNRRLLIQHFCRAAMFVCIVLCLLFIPEESSRAESLFGQLELDVKSQYSHIRVRRKNQTLAMLFVRDTKEEVVESILDLNEPSKLIVPYTRFMFLSYAFQPKHEKVLIVGLGGGSMVHFLRHHDPSVVIDVVEIDPEVVRIADEHFGVRASDRVSITTMDGVDYLSNTTSKYDVIYMDAFLKPSHQTDTTGVPIRLKTLQFYKLVQSTLKPGGLTVFNLNPHAGLKEDVASIKDAFPQVYSFSIPRRSGQVIVASTASKRQPHSTILHSARTLDRRFNTSFSFATMARRLSK